MPITCRTKPVALVSNAAIQLEYSKLHAGQAQSTSCCSCSPDSLLWHQGALVCRQMCIGTPNAHLNCKEFPTLHPHSHDNMQPALPAQTLCPRSSITSLHRKTSCCSWETPATGLALPACRAASSSLSACRSSRACLHQRSAHMLSVAACFSACTSAGIFDRCQQLVNSS